MKRKYLILFSLSGLMLSLDQLTKHLMLWLQPVGERVVLPSLLSFNFSRNNGFAFGMLKNAPASLQEVFFIGIPIFALVLIVLIFIKLQDDEMLPSVALATILAGAVGNLVDRLQYGYVVDFVQLQLGPSLHLPAFNVADCSIVVGVVIMFVNTLRAERRQA